MFVWLVGFVWFLFVFFNLSGVLGIVMETALHL